MLRLFMAVIGVVAALGATPAVACAVGGVQTLFVDRPRNVPAGLEVVHGRLLTEGRRVEAARVRTPHSREGSFIGLLHERGRPWREALPVYAGNSSCHHDTFGGVDESGRVVYLMGRRMRADAALPARFAAAGRRYR